MSIIVPVISKFIANFLGFSPNTRAKTFHEISQNEIQLCQKWLLKWLVISSNNFFLKFFFGVEFHEICWYFESLFIYLFIQTKSTFFIVILWWIPSDHAWLQLGHCFLDSQYLCIIDCKIEANGVTPIPVATKTAWSTPLNMALLGAP